MNKFFEQLKNEGQNVRLSAAEKSAMKARILSVPSTVPASKPSPYVSHSFSLSIYFRGVVVALLVVALVGSGTAYAAEGALPGEPLYAVKININEKVRVALAASPAVKAQVHAALAERRVEEAETLAARGALDAAISEHLATNFEEHVRIVESSTLALAESDLDEANRVEVEFNSSIKAHGEILAQLRFGTTTGLEDSKEESGIARAVFAVANHSHNDEDEGPDLEVVTVLAVGSADSTVTLAVAPRAAKMSTASAPAPEAMETADAEGAARLENKNSVGGSQKTAALLEERASVVLKEAQEKYAKLKSSLSSGTRVSLDARFASTSALMSRASAELGAGEYAAAQKGFGVAMRMAIELSAYLGAQQKFEKQNILPELLRNSESLLNPETSDKNAGL